MDFYKALQSEHSKTLTKKIVAEIISNPKRMKDIVDLTMDSPPGVTHKAAWSLSVVAETHPEFLKPYLPVLVKKLEEKGNHPAINRNIVRALQFIDIPKSLVSQVVNNCFILLNSNNEPPAVRVFSMTVLHKLTDKYPDLKQELKSSISTQFDQQSAGFRSRGRKILKALKSDK